MIKTENLRIILPSNRECLINELTLEDINRLSEGASRKDEALVDILQRLVIINPDSENPSKFIVNDSPLADYFTAMVGVRRVTHGDDLTWKMVCENSNCGHQWEHNIDLSDDRYEPKIIKFAKDNDLTTGVDENTLEFIFELDKPHNEVDKLRCRLFFGKDQKRLNYIDKNFPKSKMTEMAKMRIVRFEGIYNPKDIDKPIEDRRYMYPDDNWLKTLPYKVWNKIDQKVQEYDGGIETSLDIECPLCGYIHEDYELPINNKNFFSQKSAKQI